MAVTITTAPVYPAPGRRVRVTPTASAGNAWRLFVTAAPLGSALRDRLDSAEASRVEVAAGYEGEYWDTVLERGGAYVFSAQDLTRGAGASGAGGYAGAPLNAPSEIVNATTAVSLYVGDRVEISLGTPAQSGRLALWIWDGTVRKTSRDAHGEETPAITATTALARIAAESASVTSLVDALADVAVATALGVPATILEDIRATFSAHADAVGSHFGVDDDQHDIDTTSQGAGALGVVAVADDLVRRIRGHALTILNASGAPASGNWHRDGSGNARADWENAPLLAGASDAAVALNAIADAHRAYEAHRVDLDVHDAADVANALAALPALLQVHSAFLTVLASQTPAAPATMNTGAVALVASGGVLGA